MPRLGDNALLKLGPILERFAARQPSYRLTEEPRAFLETIGALEGEDAAAALERVRAVEPRLVPLVEPMLGVSLAPTRVFASDKINVIPSPREPGGRLPRARRAWAWRRRRTAIDEVLGDGEYRIEWLEQVDGQPLADRLAARRR